MTNKIPEKEPTNDREMLEYLMGQFDFEVHVCARCGENDPTENCDSAITLREYLASTTQQQAPVAWLNERDFYEVMYAYRHAGRVFPAEAVEAFEAVKDFIRSRSHTQAAEQPVAWVDMCEATRQFTRMQEHIADTPRRDISETFAEVAARLGYRLSHPQAPDAAIGVRHE